jgi:hypothetical protein
MFCKRLLVVLFCLVTIHGNRSLLASMAFVQIPIDDSAVLSPSEPFLKDPIEGGKAALRIAAKEATNWAYHTVFIKKHIEFLADEIWKNHATLLPIVQRKLTDSTRFDGELSQYIKDNHTLTHSLESCKKCLLPAAVAVLTNFIRRSIITHCEIPYFSGGHVADLAVLPVGEVVTELSYDCTTEGVVRSLPKWLLQVVIMCFDSRYMSPVVSKSGNGRYPGSSKWLTPVGACLIDLIRVYSFGTFCRNMWMKHVCEHSQEFSVLLERYQDALTRGEENLSVVKNDIVKFIEDGHKNFLPLRHAFL